MLNLSLTMNCNDVCVIYYCLDAMITFVRYVYYKFVHERSPERPLAVLLHTLVLAACKLEQQRPSVL